HVWLRGIRSMRLQRLSHDHDRARWTVPEDTRGVEWPRAARPPDPDRSVRGDGGGLGPVREHGRLEPGSCDLGTSAPWPGPVRPRRPCPEGQDRMTLPTFIIAGAQKAGTTSLYSMLAQHPDVFMSEPKEPGFFVRGFDDPERWQTLKRPGMGGIPESLASVRQGIFTKEEYSALFGSDAAQRARHRGEASTPYLPSPHAARRIAETCPDIRIILSLRDPVMRAYSAWGYNYARGTEAKDSF